MTEFFLSFHFGYIKCQLSSTLNKHRENLIFQTVEKYHLLKMALYIAHSGP